MRSGIIVLVEDRDDDIELTLRAFRKSSIGNDVVVLRDGAEALEYLIGEERQAGRLPMPEIVLLDLNLPKVSGLDVLRKVRADEHMKRVPVVILTSSNEERDIVASYDLGANSFIQKPVDFAQFVEATRQLGLYWLVLNRGAPT
ncbi:MAG TPA: response regulator [Polyangiaceae bacterium]|jgi:DNA-binding response OmpR family regulator|nr:response regulator [Polyangiaceae bacterium]